MRSVYALGIVLFVLAGSGAAVRAQDAQSVPAEPTEEDRRLSALLLDRSAVAYRLGRYAEAVVMLEDAYVLSREPILLYNLGRAYEGAGDPEHALNAYRRYLEASSDSADGDAVRATIVLLELQVEAAAYEAREAAERARVEAIRREAEIQRAERDARAQAERLARAEREARQGPAPWPWVIAGAGAATLVAGAIVGGVALDREQAAAHEPVQTVAMETLAAARDLATGANAAFVVGGVLAATGVAWAIVDLTGLGGEREVSIEATPTLGGMAVRGTF